MTTLISDNAQATHASAFVVPIFAAEGVMALGTREY
jgi:hypothetical protein